jgi:uncharacterized DUF497 family protein
MQFEWDPEKASANLAKHGVSFQDASTVFSDPLAGTIPNPLHSAEERRFITIGHSAAGLLIVVVHAERGDRLRIITAMPATRSERTEI